MLHKVDACFFPLNSAGPRKTASFAGYPVKKHSPLIHLSVSSLGDICDSSPTSSTSKEIFLYLSLLALSRSWTPALQDKDIRLLVGIVDEDSAALLPTKRPNWRGRGSLVFGSWSFWTYRETAVGNEWSLHLKGREQGYKESDCALYSINCECLSVE